MNKLVSYAKSSRVAKSLGVIVALVVLYAVLGFLIAPLLLKSVLISNIKESLKRDAHLERLRLNPFALSLTAEGFKVYDLDGEQLTGFRELYINFQLSSLVRRAYTFDEVRLVSPNTRVKVLPDGTLNFSDLLGPADQPEPPSEEKGGLPQVLIYRLAVEEGRLSFLDLSRRTPFETMFFPIQISLENFSTQKDSDSPYAFTASTREREVFRWEGNLSVSPLRSQGRFNLNAIRARKLWEYIQDRVNFDITDGEISLSGEYDAQISGEAPRIRLIDGEARLNDFKLTERGSLDVLTSLPAFTATGVDIDVTEKRVTVSSVKSSDARYVMWLSPDGTLNYLKLFRMQGGPKGVDKAAPRKSEQAGSDEGQWTVVVKEAILDNYAVAFEDRTLPKPARMNLDAIHATVKNLSTRRGSRAEVALNLKINETGTIEAEGQAGRDPLYADLALKFSNVALKPFNAYAASAANLDIQRGALSLKGAAKYRALGDSGPLIRYVGNMSLENFKAVSKVYSEDFLNWQSVAFSDLTLDIKPDTLNISEVLARKLHTRVIIWPNGTLNLTSMLTRKGGGKHDGDRSPAERPPMPVAIKKVTVKDSSADFADLSLKPSFAIGIHDLKGTISGLSSKTRARADVSLEGKVDEYAPITIEGQINPLSDDVYTDLTMKFQNVELTSFTPYSGKFAGYAIEKGKVSLDLKYKVSENVLIGENKIVLDQLTLGERVDSPTATKLPVSLAVALLKDRNGVIDIDLPIRGDLNDPEFSYGHLIFQALMNLLAKALTSPFALLGGLVGGSGEELSFVEFPFGSSELAAGEMGKLDTLAEALSERPMLRLEVKGKADTEYDRLVLAEEKLLNQLKSARMQELGESKKPGAVEDIVLSDDDYACLILQTYIETFGEDPKILLASPPDESTTDEAKAANETQTPESARRPGQRVLNAGQGLLDNVQGLLGLRSETSVKSRAIVREMGRSSDSLDVLVERASQRLIENTVIEEIELRVLAQERANHVKGYLIERGGISNERIYLLDAELGPVSDGTALRVDLALSG
ncbi:MAG: DUF748 domain-containing protein [Candidatus Abyssobacteria bacterium SURF_17]|uniref:DUF748 domain-containing protein n=1 Tax=Candidatus Abyssobacteria bacterium SURF_17 TaxID=2093361 RepID=A0A419EQ87_9BACT|nr:MAG: DUF748 domain-containing protein [Candidatus Abyssubacteria bacterium SURF_17]